MKTIFTFKVYYKRIFFTFILYILFFKLNRDFDTFSTFLLLNIYENYYMEIVDAILNIIKRLISFLSFAYNIMGGGMMIAWFYYLYLKIKG